MFINKNTLTIIENTIFRSFISVTIIDNISFIYLNNCRYFLVNNCLYSFNLYRLNRLYYIN